MTKKNIIRYEEIHCKDGVTYYEVANGLFFNTKKELTQEEFYKRTLGSDYKQIIQEREECNAQARARAQADYDATVVVEDSLTKEQRHLMTVLVNSITEYANGYHRDWARLTRSDPVSVDENQAWNPSTYKCDKREKPYNHYRLVNESMFISSMPDFENMPNFKLGKFLYTLIQHMNDFEKTHDISAFKHACEEEFEHSQYDKYKSTFSEIYDAVILVFRSFFLLFDYMITFACGSQETMAKSYNPLARSLFKRDHILEYSKELPIHPSSTLKKLKKDFSEALGSLEKTTIFPGPANQSNSI